MSNWKKGGIYDLILQEKEKCLCKLKQCCFKTPQFKTFNWLFNHVSNVCDAVLSSNLIQVFKDQDIIYSTTSSEVYIHTYIYEICHLCTAMVLSSYWNRDECILNI